MTNWARIERHRLCELLEEVGPDAPTLCGDWRTRDLAAHLILRERRPDAVPGVVIKLRPLRRHTESVQRTLADPARDWATTVDTIRQGPPHWSLMRLGPIDQLVNTVEFFVHHEDVRRGSDAENSPTRSEPTGSEPAGSEPAGAQPRQLEADLARTLTAAGRRIGALLRRTPVALELRLPDGEVIVRRQAHRGRGRGDGAATPLQANGTVVVTGEAGELVLFAYGRQAVAAVELTGADSAVAAVRQATFGL